MRILVQIPIALFLIFLAYAFFVLMPMAFYAEAECLEKGYPKGVVSIKAKMYCMNLSGSVTVAVDKL